MSGHKKSRIKNIYVYIYIKCIYPEFPEKNSKHFSALKYFGSPHQIIPVMVETISNCFFLQKLSFSSNCLWLYEENLGQIRIYWNYYFLFNAALKKVLSLHFMENLILKRNLTYLINIYP